MNDPLRNRFGLQIKALKGFDFQDFIVELFLLKYGAQGFMDMRKQKDKGCDGICHLTHNIAKTQAYASNSVLQAYASINSL